MRGKWMCVLGLALAFGGSALAQDKAEVSVDYSYSRFNPSSSLADDQNLNGGGGSFAYYWKDLFGVKADFQGYASTTTHFTVPTGNANVPAGTYSVNGNLFTYLFGPVIQPRKAKIAPYGQILFGAAHSNVYSNLFHVSSAAGSAPSNNAFAMAVGGGLDLKLTRHWTLRPVEADYLLTNFNSDFVSGGNRVQNNFRYAAGVTFRF